MRRARIATCHSDRKHWALGKCHLCYTRERRHSTQSGARKEQRRTSFCHPDTPHYAKGLCRKCYDAALATARNEASRVSYAKNPDRIRESCYQKKFGISVTDFDNMMTLQSGVCAGCFRPPSANKRLCVDHCHVSGQIRGLLCDSCNRAVGALFDRSETFRRLATYLEISFLKVT